MIGCCNCDPIINLTVEGKNIRKKLEYCLYFYLIMILFKIFLIDYTDFLENLIIFILIILLIFQLNFIWAIVLIFFSIFNFFYGFVVCLLLIQNHILGIDNEYIEYYNLYILFYLVYTIFLVALIKFTFEAYREFKAIFIETEASGYSKYFLV